MKKFGYLAAFAFICPFQIKAEPVGNLVQEFPKPLEVSIWSNPSYIRYDNGSRPSELNRLFNEFGHTEAEIVNKLGSPIDRGEEHTPNRHEPEHTRNRIQLFYKGLAVELVVTHHPRSYVDRLFISNCDIPSRFQQYLCSTVASFKQRIGNPSIETDSELIYLITIGDMGSVPLRIMTADGIVTGIYTKNFID